MTAYQCIECGSRVESLYRDFKAGIMKISRCKSCSAVADKYVEYDPVIIFLDALLLQPQAYRHLLINTQFDSHWRLALLLWVCNAFTKLVLHRSELSSQKSIQSVNYSYLGLELYVNYMIAAAELLTVLVSVLAVLSLRSVWYHKSFTSVNTSLVIKAVIVSSVGHILAMPALLWGQEYSHIYLGLGQAFVALSALQALKVVTPGTNSTVWAAAAIGLGLGTRAVVSATLHSWLDPSFT